MPVFFISLSKLKEYTWNNRSFDSHLGVARHQPGHSSLLPVHPDLWERLDVGHECFKLGVLVSVIFVNTENHGQYGAQLEVCHRQIAQEGRPDGVPLQTRELVFDLFVSSRDVSLEVVARTCWHYSRPHVIADTQNGLDRRVVLGSLPEHILTPALLSEVFENGKRLRQLQISAYQIRQVREFQTKALLVLAKPLFRVSVELVFPFGPQNC